MNNKALLVIDMQVALFDEQPYAGETLLANIDHLLGRARAAKVPVIYVQHCSRSEAPMAPGADGWQIHPAIAPTPGEIVVQKWNPDAFQATTLQEELDKLGVQQLIVTGMQTDYCVDTTCRRAYSLGYDVTLVQDGHSTCDSAALPAAQIIAHHNAVLGNWFARLQPASEVDL
jgi:nicotinamidase-related amidase